MAYEDDQHPPTDESGDVDLDLLESNLKLSPAQRIEQNYNARLFAAKLAAAGAKHFGHPDVFNDRSIDEPPAAPEG